MNRSSSLYQDSQFGPPSELINVGDFLRLVDDSQRSTNEAISISLESPENIPGWTQFQSLSLERQAAIAADCSIDDISTQLNATLDSPALAATIIKTNRAVLSSIYDAADMGKSRRRPRRDVLDPEAEVSMEVRELQVALDGVQLRSTKLDMRAAVFLRTSVNSDYNALSFIKYSNSAATEGMDVDLDPDAIVTISIHSPVSWAASYITKISTHAFVSSQTLGDVLKVVPCAAIELPPAQIDDKSILLSYHSVNKVEDYVSLGAVLFVEGTVYGEGREGDDYADKLLAGLASKNSSRYHTIIKGAPICEVPLSSLSVRLHEPYWLLHAGNCVHFITFDEICLASTAEPRFRYPVAIYYQPLTLNMCRACGKVPAIWAISGDLRLGESPCVLCAQCWRSMGSPKNCTSEKIVVACLPKYELGW